jgi:hypothetical protein
VADPVPDAIPLIPASVTEEEVLRVIAQSGSATASQIADEVSSGGQPVSPEAIRILAKRAGIEKFVAEDGPPRYRLRYRKCCLPECDYTGPPGTCPVHDQS